MKSTNMWAKHIPNAVSLRELVDRAEQDVPSASSLSKLKNSYRPVAVSAVPQKVKEVVPPPKSPPVAQKTTELPPAKPKKRPTNSYSFTDNHLFDQ